MIDLRLSRSTDGRFLADGGSPRPRLAPADLAFVLCVEANVLGSQAILLCESIRRYGGAYRDCPIWAISPRPELAATPGVRGRLQALGATCLALPLNGTGSAYGSINRIVAGAWAEANIPASHLCILDTDMALVAEPAFAEGDAGVRPVDVKGMASAGPDDPMEGYWAEVCAIGGIPLDGLPMVVPTMGGAPVRASYNGGFLLVRRSLGILAKTSRIFFETFRRDLRPRPGMARSIFASTGPTGAEVASWWGSSQAALAVAISARARSIDLYGAGYNIPVHLLARAGDGPRPAAAPVLLHYHYLAAEPHRAAFLRCLEGLGCPPEPRAWIAARCAALDWPLEGAA